MRAPIADAPTAYAAPAWLPGGHAQTIFPVLLRPSTVAYRRERVDTPDGDFWLFDWLIDAEPRRGMFGLQVAFVHPDAVHGVLSELVSRG